MDAFASSSADNTADESGSSASTVRLVKVGCLADYTLIRCGRFPLSALVLAGFKGVWTRARMYGHGTAHRPTVQICMVTLDLSLHTWRQQSPQARASARAARPPPPPPRSCGTPPAPTSGRATGATEATCGTCTRR